MHYVCGYYVCQGRRLRDGLGLVAVGQPDVIRSTACGMQMGAGGSLHEQANQTTAADAEQDRAEAARLRLTKALLT